MPPSAPSRWPAPLRAAIAFTMDNLGEAQDVLRGTWSQPIGTHPAVTSQLPRMLSLLSQHSKPHRPLRATYFVEAWSLGVYPAAVASLLREGHEVAWHGYQHEVWGELGETEESESFKKSWRALEEVRHAVAVAGKAAASAAAAAGGAAVESQEEGQVVEVEYRGFRPPGGTINDRTWPLMKEYGIEYVSPLGEVGIGNEGVVVLPFEWRAVDAFWYMEKFAGIRKDHGEREEVHSPKEFRDWLMRKIDEVVEAGGFMSILFHPFLQTTEERFAVMEEVVKRLSEDERIWVAPCREIARWVKEHPENFAETT
ncbi:hypothetical protein VTJ04DRAFT_5872 [Mycothermus thermophilus]|uniref:uncharacterized protein n=1 Tax=Humicola insolens TaxID=85995 RepID=UPI00374302B7